jgi:RND superfamily putative drug exporter
MMRAIAEWVVLYRWWVITGWLALCATLVPQAGKLERELDVVARVRGSEALGVERALAARFNSPFAHFVVVVVNGLPSSASPAGRDTLDMVAAAVRGVVGVSGTLSYLDTGDTLFVGVGGRGALIVVGLDPADGRLDAMIPRLRATTEALAARLRMSRPDVAFRWTGEIAINFDLRRTSAEEANNAERRVLPLTLILLLLAFGAIVAALVPLLSGALAITIALGAAVLINRAWVLSILLQNTVTMIGLGVGIDYALLTVSRFREAMRAGGDAKRAAVEAAHHSGSTIALSGAAVAIGFAALLLVPVNELQSTGVGGILVVALSVLIAVTLLPAILSLLGRGLDVGRLPWRRTTKNGPSGKRWRAWGRIVVRYPWLVLFVAGAPLAAFAWQSRRLSAEVPRGNWLPARMESARAIEDLTQMRRSGMVNELRVMLELPPTVIVSDDAGWAAIRRLTDVLARDPRVARVQSIVTVLPFERPNPMLLALVPAAIRRSLISADEHAVVIEVVPPETADFNDLTDLSRHLRRLDIAEITGLRGASIGVGGMPAFNADYIAAIGARFWRVVALVVLGSFVAMVVGFRSVVVPLKAIALNLLSVGAAFGVVVLVFQDGHGVRWLGLSGPLHGVFPAVPIIAFCIVFGMSMDYEVFLVSRVAEERRRMPEDDAIIEGLARTGGVITSAAAIMIAVFGAFTLGDFVFIKILGFALMVAVLFDATVVRLAIGPALLKLAGRWYWWPGGGGQPLAANIQHSIADTESDANNE